MFLQLPGKFSHSTIHLNQIVCACKTFIKFHKQVVIVKLHLLTRGTERSYKHNMILYSVDIPTFYPA